ncbi:hypothetical protein FA95DRAFT_1613366 [Auriscalpium vulgare]|uniref:Uncharacterized protein n=1 Tax=Auriscalpium vulgare TaxID=40419 RepID=A0ACB8R327_9AGAM|nr:hypothetical protein FA95DRAFT_1613366 [Auriscalpium vulgare]
MSAQRWRNIALLSEPILWAADIALPSLLGDLWAVTFLSRAQDVLLTVTQCSELSSDHDNARSISANLAAILDLRTNVTHGLLSLCTSAPLLHTPQLPFLSDSLFGGAAGLPELRHRSVVAWELQSWPPLLLAQLVSVNITIIVPDMPGSVLTSMFAALGRMRGLEQLALHLHLKDADRVLVISPPALGCLTLQANARDARLLLARLALPAGVGVRCDVYWTINTQAEISTLFPAITAFRAQLP